MYEGSYVDDIALTLIQIKTETEITSQRPFSRSYRPANSWTSLTASTLLDSLKAPVQELDYIVRLVNPVYRAISPFYAQAGHLVFTPLVDQFAVPLRVIAGIPGFDIEAHAANRAPGFYTERALPELVELHGRCRGVELGPLFRRDDRYFRACNPVDENHDLAQRPAKYSEYIFHRCF